MHCSFATGDVTSAPTSIVYIPEGEHTITANVNGSPKTVTVNATREILASFVDGLADRKTRNVRAITDFDHEGKGPASAIPLEFRWEDGRGLVLDVEWTQAGREAIEGKDYSYFSPDFLLGADGVPTGIAKRGPLGSLVNDPAFEEIERIAAASAGSDDEPEPDQPENEMEILATCGLLTKDEAAKENAATLAASRVTALKNEPETVRASAASAVQKTLRAAADAADISDEMIGALGVQASFSTGAQLEDIAKGYSALLIKAAKQEEAITKHLEDAADQFVADAIKAGKIGSKNEPLLKFWRTQHLENPEAAVEAMNAQPKIAPGITQTVVAAAASDDSPLADVNEMAAAHVEAGRARNQGDALSIVFREHPEKYQAYRESTYSKSSE